MLSVSAKGTYCAAVTETGELWTWGRGDSGQLGLGTGETSACVPRPVRGALHGKVVKAVSCGEHHCAAITDTHSLFTWGRGQSGRLGHGSVESECSPRLVEALVGIQVMSVSCGEFHTVVATSVGIYTFGLGLSGRLGLGDEEDRFLPTPIPAFSPKPVLQISAGGHHTAVLVHPGVLYLWGGGAFGKLGHGDSISCLTPRLVTALSHVRVASVDLGQHHSAAVSVGGDVFVWGKSQGSNCQDLLEPEKASDFPSAASVACGKSQVYALTHSGDLFVRGPLSPELLSTSVGFVPTSEFTGQTNRQQSYCLIGKGVVHLVVGDLHCIAMADAARAMANRMPLTDCDSAPVPELVSTPTRVSGSATPPSLVHVLESVIRAVPPPPPRPSVEGEIVFLSTELKYAQSQNQKLGKKLEETLTRIAHLERENVTLREELDASLQCLPVDRMGPPTPVGRFDAATSPVQFLIDP